MTGQTFDTANSGYSGTLVKFTFFVKKTLLYNIHYKNNNNNNEYNI